MKIWVSVCDSSRLRLFQADKPNDQLHEISDKYHGASRERERELVTDRPGVAHGRGQTHTLADENDQHKEEAAQFAREVADVLNRGALDSKYTKLYILAPPAFLGHLRKQLSEHTRKLVAEEIPVNLTKETADHIRRQLGEYL
jgi:protein required for attachment to host cells